MKTQDTYEQISKEIVSYVQNYQHNTKKCVDFVEYALRLRFIAKDDLRSLCKENDIQ